MASKKKGSITTIMQMVAALLFPKLRIRKNSGTPTSAPLPKQISCRLVRLNAILDLTAFKSLGMGTYAITITSNQCALNTLLASEPVLNSEKHSSTV